jgi:hypothetical protein
LSARMTPKLGIESSLLREIHALMGHLTGRCIYLWVHSMKQPNAQNLTIGFLNVQRSEQGVTDTAPQAAVEPMPEPAI